MRILEVGGLGWLWHLVASGLAIFFLSLTTLPPDPDNPSPPSHPRELGFGPFRVRFGSFQVRFGSFRVRFRSVSGQFRVSLGVFGRVGVGS